MAEATRNNAKRTSVLRSSLPRDPRATVTDLYEVLCESRMNVKYYGEKLAFYQRWSLAIQVLTAIGTSTTVLTLPFVPKPVSIILSGIAAILATLLPILNLSKRIQRASQLWAGYMAAFTSAQSVMRQVKLRKCVDVVDERMVQDIHDKMDVLCKEDDSCPKKEDVDRLQAEVVEQYPTTEFWWPPQSVITT